MTNFTPLGELSRTSKTRVRGFAPWKPSAKSEALIADVLRVLKEYEHVLPLSVRQVFYRLVATAAYAKTEASYKALGEAMNRARRAGLVPFSAIRDDGHKVERPLFWGGEAEFLRSMQSRVDWFRLDRQLGQETRLFVLSEAAGVVPMLAQIAKPFGIVVASGGGFDSVTAKHALAKEIASCDEPVEILHLGDHDTSGTHVYSSLAEDVMAFCKAIGAFPTFTRLAVTPEQALAMGLPSAPPKATDRRSFEGDETWQLEAIPPDVLQDMVREAITSRRDPDIEAELLAKEAEIRNRLRARLGGIA